MRCPETEIVSYTGSTHHDPYEFFIGNWYGKTDVAKRSDMIIIK
jgi:hypothetical protein